MLIADLLSTVSLIAGFAVVAAAGLFTVRSNIAQTWKDNYDAERTARRSAEDEAKQQRAMKHELQTELAAVRMKTDLTPLIEYVNTLRADLEKERVADVERLERKIDATVAEVLELLEGLQRSRDEA